MLMLDETNQILISEIPTPCTFVIVPGSSAIMYRTHSSIISFPYNDKRVQCLILTSESTRNTIWYKPLRLNDK
jgi:hypothetical protein